MTINFDLIINLLFTYINFYETYDFYLKFLYAKKYIIISKLIVISPKNTLVDFCFGCITINFDLIMYFLHI